MSPQAIAIAPARLFPEMIQVAGLHGPILFDKLPGAARARRKAEDWFAEASCRNALRSIPPGFFVGISDKGPGTWVFAGGMVAVASTYVWIKGRGAA